jgi:hypothetical protein
MPVSQRYEVKADHYDSRSKKKASEDKQRWLCGRNNPLHGPPQTSEEDNAKQNSSG